MEEFEFTADENLIVTLALSTLAAKNRQALTDALFEASASLFGASEYHANENAVLNLSTQFVGRFLRKLERHDQLADSTEIYEAGKVLNAAEFEYYALLNERFPLGASEAERRGEAGTELRKLFAKYESANAYFLSLTA